MLRNGLVVLGAILCCGCVSRRAERAGGVLGECRKAYGHLSAHVTLRREEGAWRPSGLILEKADVGDADLQRLATLRTLESLEITTIWAGQGRVTPGGIQQLRAVQHLRRLRLLLRLPETSLKAIGSLKQLEDLDLAYCTGLSGADLAYLRNTPRLRRLSLAHAGLTDAALRTSAYLRPSRN